MLGGDLVLQMGMIYAANPLISYVDVCAMLFQRHYSGGTDVLRPYTFVDVTELPR